MNNQSDKKIQFQPIAVDLGLSVKWASCNLGAKSPECIGNYFKWGETEPSEDDSWETYKYYDIKRKKGFCIGGEITGSQFDAVRKYLGNNWRMPTCKEVCELLLCTWKWSIFNGVYGYYVIAPNGNSIFFPVCNHDSIERSCAKEYWTGSMSDNDPIISDPICLMIEVFDNDYPNCWGCTTEVPPCFCLPIRPVTDL